MESVNGIGSRGGSGFNWPIALVNDLNTDRIFSFAPAEEAWQKNKK
jgi:hypothetical protein